MLRFSTTGQSGERGRALEKQSLLSAGAVVETRHERPRRSFGRCFSMPRGTCRQLATGLDIRPTCILALVERLLCRVRSLGTVPLAWHHSSGDPLHTSNMPGPKERRLVHVLPSMGKQFFKALMRRKPNGGGWSQPEPADMLHGYISRRRRESAVLIRQVTTWRLERIWLKSLTAFHDMTNAFGSVEWKAMDRAVASLLGPNALIGQQRYRLATTTIPGRDGDITLKTGEGWLMVDPLMVASLPSTIPWQQQVSTEGAESEQLLAWHPWSGARIDLSLSQFADDTTKQIVAEQGEDVVALARRVQSSNGVLDGALAVVGFSQNRGKEADRRRVREGQVQLPGKVVFGTTHVLRHHRQMETVSSGSYKSVPSLSCDLWRQKRGSSSLAVINSSWVLS